MKRFNNCTQCYIIIMFYIIDTVQSVPDEYCLHPLNKSDCHIKPMAVFSYYKPGSRCEIEMWRGCPTLNKFDNEYACSQQCIFRLSPERGKENGTIEDLPITEPVHNPYDPKNECLAIINTGTCSNTTKSVYTYLNGTCVETNWHGCPTGNKFKDKHTCVEICLNASVSQWKQELAKLPEKQIQKLSMILENFENNDQKDLMKEESTETPITELEEPNELEESVEIEGSKQVEETEENHQEPEEPNELEESVEIEESKQIEETEENHQKPEKPEELANTEGQNKTAQQKESNHSAEPEKPKETIVPQEPDNSAGNEEPTESAKLEKAEESVEDDSGDVSEVLTTRKKFNRTYKTLV